MHIQHGEEDVEIVHKKEILVPLLMKLDINLVDAKEIVYMNVMVRIIH